MYDKSIILLLYYLVYLYDLYSIIIRKYTYII